MRTTEIMKSDFGKCASNLYISRLLSIFVGEIMEKNKLIQCLCVLQIILLLMGCSKQDKITGISINATTPIEVDAEVLNDVSLTLPERMTREAVSAIQHDFTQDGNQVGGIVIVDISNELLDSPRGDNLLKITSMLGEQLMPYEDPDDIEFMCAGGNDFAYLEIYTGGEQIRYCHYLFRGETNKYDVWFNYGLVSEETITEIIATVSADDITTELNNSVM